MNNVGVAELDVTDSETAEVGAGVLAGGAILENPEGRDPVVNPTDHRVLWPLEKGAIRGCPSPSGRDIWSFERYAWEPGFKLSEGRRGQRGSEEAW